MAGAEDVGRKLFERRHRMTAGLILMLKNAGMRMQAEGKRPPGQGGAPWKDRTGHARGGLISDVVVVDDEIKLRYAHTMEYGIHLEKGHSGRYAELEPRINLHKDQILRNAQEILEKGGA